MWSNKRTVTEKELREAKYKAKHGHKTEVTHLINKWNRVQIKVNNKFYPFKYTSKRKQRIDLWAAKTASNATAFAEEDAIFDLKAAASKLKLLTSILKT